MTATTRKVNTPFATLSYPVLTDAQFQRAVARNAASATPSQKTKFAATLVIPTGSDLSELYAAAELAVTEKFGDKIKVGPKTFTAKEALEKGIIRSPFRTDAEAKGYPEGSTFIGAKTETKPGIIHPNREPMTEAEVERLMYPGATVRASVTFYGYDVSGNKGIAAALNALQWVKDGDRLDNRVAASEEFTALDSTPADISSLVG